MAEGNRALKITAATVNAGLFLLLLLFNYYASRPNEGPFRHLFGNATTGEVSDDFYIEITPAGWAFSIWGLIYLWQSAWIIYSLTLLCRRSTTNVISSVLLLIYAISNVANIAWLILWSREMVQASSVVLFATAFLLYGTLATSYMSVNLETLTVPKLDFILTQVLVNNGVALYATWCTIASLLNLTMALAYFHGVAQDVACTISLVILAVEIIVWFSLENTILDKYVRYTLTIYPVVIWALSASINKNWDPAKRNSIISVILLSVACALLIVRIAIVVWRETKKKARVVNSTAMLLHNS
ncbi:uncharacterized protein LOC144649392 [Oculina patagonica]